MQFYHQDKYEFAMKKNYQNSVEAWLTKRIDRIQHPIQNYHQTEKGSKAILACNFYSIKKLAKLVEF